MTQPIDLTTNSKFQMLSAGALLLAMVGCGGGGTDVAQNIGQTLPESNAIGSSQPQEDEGTAKPVEQITAATGVQITFADEAQKDSIGGDYIESQWVQMQTCLQITAQTPAVRVVSDRITPLTSDDDVLRFIDGSVLATATVTSTDATIQITEADFDGSLGPRATTFAPLSVVISGFSASLPERDYPYHCANQ